MALKICRFVAFLFLALVLGAGLAHLFTMPSKMTLSGEAYLTVQQLYRDWTLLNVALACTVLSLLVLVWQLWPRSGRRLFSGGYSAAARAKGARTVRWRALVLTLLALLAVLGDEIIIWSLARSADLATRNWTVLPADWMALRAQWEYAHAAAAVLDLVAFAALVLSVLVGERPVSSRGPDEESGGRGAPLLFMAAR